MPACFVRPSRIGTTATSWRPLAARPQAAQRNAARVLFQGLWWYDPVVFDASARAERWPAGTTHSQAACAMENSLPNMSA